MLPFSRLCLFAFILVVGATPSPAQEKEYVIMAGGPALWEWEQLRLKKRQHDKWWANFVRASTLRMVDLQGKHGANIKITWIVYRPGYATRAREAKEDYLDWIQKLGIKYNAELIWIDSGPEAIAALNARPEGSITSFDYFGHANPHAFMLDYSNNILGISKAWIHERDLAKINRQVFAAEPVCKSWGCHTGQSMSLSWRRTLGIPLIGTEGRTDYAPVSKQAILPTTEDRWVR